MFVSSSLLVAAVCVAGAAVTFETFPDRVLKRKLGALLRMNDFHVDLKQYGVRPSASRPWSSR